MSPIKYSCLPLGYPIRLTAIMVLFVKNFLLHTNALFTHDLIGMIYANNTDVFLKKHYMK